MLDSGAVIMHVASHWALISAKSSNYSFI